MNALNFCYFLQGYFEIGGRIELNEIQVQEIKNHITLVKGGLVFQGADLTVENKYRHKNGEPMFIC